MIQTERLSPNTMLVFSQARLEAKRSGNHLVGSEHLLLGIVATADDTLKEILTAAALDEAGARKTAEEISGPRQPHDRDDLDFTPRVQRLMTRAFSEADLLHHQLVEPKHIMIAILREDAGIATRILERLQVHTTTLLKALIAA